MHLRPCIPLHFSAKHSDLVLTDICPHRRKFTACKSFFCNEAQEKFQWLDVLREKARNTEQIVAETDHFLRSKLLDAFEAYNHFRQKQNSQEVSHHH